METSNKALWNKTSLIWNFRCSRNDKKLTEFLDLSYNQLKSIGGDMLIESPGLQTIDLSGNTNLSKICRSSFVRHEHLQQGKIQTLAKNQMFPNGCFGKKLNDNQHFWIFISKRNSDLQLNDGIRPSHFAYWCRNKTLSERPLLPSVKKFWLSGAFKANFSRFSD